MLGSGPILTNSYQGIDRVDKDVVESARGHVELGFWDYARYGIPVTILTTAAGMLILLLLHG